MTTTILEDERPIREVRFGEEGNFHAIGVRECIKIEAYGEPDRHCSVPWIAVYNSAGITIRFEASKVSIHY